MSGIAAVGADAAAAGPGRRALLVALVALAAGLPALRPGFIHDDHRLIEQNDLIRDLRRAPEIFARGYWTVGDENVPNLYRPLTILSFALNHAVHGLAPLGFRAVNLGLHVLATLLVLALARRALPSGAIAGPPGGGLDAALFAALLVAVHPIPTEVLGLVVGRAELLAAALTLGGLLLFLRGRDADASGAAGRARALSGLAALAFAAGFLCKENAVAGPVLALAADRLIVRRRPAWGALLAAAAAVGAAFALRAAVIGGINPRAPIHFVDNPIAHQAFLPGRLLALKVAARYAGLLLVPVNQSIDYSYAAIAPLRSLLDPGALAGLALVAGGAALLLATRRHAPGFAFGLAFAGIAFAPVANLFLPIGTAMAERLLYLPSAGFCVAAGAALLAALGRGGAEGRAARAASLRASTTIVLVVFAALSVVRLRDWRDDHTIFAAAVRVGSESVRARFNYGAAAEERGEGTAAEAAYLAALATFPDFGDAHYNLAGLYARTGRPDEAVRHYREALRVRPGEVRYLVNLGRTLNAAGHHEEARAALGRAVAIDPASHLAHNNLGAAELALGNAEAAVRAYEEAVRLDPDNAGYLRNLGLALATAGRPHEAAAIHRQALDLRPGDPDLLDALGMALLQAGDAAGAGGAFGEAVRARPAHPVYRYHLGRALQAAGHAAGAAEEYRQAARLAPGNPQPLVALGLLLRREGDRAGARDALERAAAALEREGGALDPAAAAALQDLRRRPPRH